MTSSAHVRPWRVCEGAIIVPPAEEMGAMCEQRDDLKLQPMSFLIWEAFLGLDEDEPHRGHPYLEMIRVLSLPRTPCVLPPREAASIRASEAGNAVY